MPSKLLLFCKIAAVILFLLFAIEIIFLHPRNLSFRGVRTEKFFFWSWIIVGFLGFGLWRFGITLLCFLGLSMVPMMIPFLSLITWSSTSNRHFELENQERLEEVWAFGQYSTYLYKVKPQGFFLEHYYKKASLEWCEGGNLREINIQQIEQQEDQLTLFYTLKDSSYTCTLPIKFTE